MTLQEKVGKAVVKLRKQRGLAQEKFAAEAAVDRRYMSDIENGKRNLSLDLLERLATSLGISVSQLLSEAENIESPFTLDKLKETLTDRGYEDSIVFERPDYATAVVGIDHDGRVVYSYEKMAENLAADGEMTLEEAYEFIDFNTIGALPYMGEKAPIILFDLDY